MEPVWTLYEKLGGAEPFRRIVGAFYDRVENDESLRPMYPRSLHCAREHLALFLVEFFGGPPNYTALRGSPRLRMRHLPLRIGQAERDHWLTHMLGALDDAGIPEPARGLMADYFTSGSAFLINQPAGSVAGRSDAALADARSAPLEPGVDSALREEMLMDRMLGAVRAGDPVRVRSLLSESGIAAFLSGNPVAHRDFLASALGSPEGPVVSEARARLERAPTLVQVRGGAGATLLHEAAGTWNTENIAFLIDLGAAVDAADEAGHTPLYRAADRFAPKDRHGAEQGVRAVLVLLEHGADPRAVGGVKRVTALHAAARRGHVLIAERLIDQGADLEARDSKGQTPLRRAVNCGHRYIVALLLSRGARADSRADDGRTPLAAARTREMREALLDTPGA